MGLKDIGKIVENAKRMDAFNEAANSTPTVDTVTNKKVKENQDSLRYQGVDTTPFTSKPASTKGHIGFKFDSRNALHKNMLDTLVNNGNDGDLVLSSRGVSVPKRIAESEAYKAKFKAIGATTEGGLIDFDTPDPSFTPQATTVKKRKPATKKAAPSSRPAPTTSEPAPTKKYTKPVAPTNVKKDLTDLFAGSNTTVDRAAEKKRAEEEAKARAAEDKARRAEARRRLLEDGDDDLPSFGSRYS